MSPGPSPHPGAEALAGVLNRLEALHAHLDREWIAFREFRVEEFGRLRHQMDILPAMDAQRRPKS